MTACFYYRKTYYLCCVKLRYHLVVDAANRLVEYENKITEKPMNEKDRWMLAAAICSAIGTAITAYFEGRK